MSKNYRIEDLRANQRLLALELKSRDIQVSILDWTNEILEAKFHDHSELFVDIDSSIVPFAASAIASSKSLTKKLLVRAGISVPKGKHFDSREMTAILDFATTELSFPIVLKPSNGVQGQNVFTGLESIAEVLAALQSLSLDLGNVEILVEEQIFAHEFRVFITKDKSFAVLHREPAYVVGDGFNSIEELAKQESYKRLNPRVNCLCEIVLDLEAKAYLRKRGLDFCSVPRKGEKIQIRGSSNVKCGGVPTDVTDLVHPSVIDICHKSLLTIPGLPYAGIDFMCSDIRKAQKPSSYRILEINSVPGIGIHMAPGRGKPRNVAGMIADLIFPESINKTEQKRWAA
jgi:cyanophycin synthetase